MSDLILVLHILRFIHVLYSTPFVTSTNLKVNGIPGSANLKMIFCRNLTVPVIMSYTTDYLIRNTIDSLVSGTDSYFHIHAYIDV